MSDDNDDKKTPVENVRAKAGSGEKWDKHASHKDKCKALGVETKK